MAQSCHEVTSASSEQTTNNNNQQGPVIGARSGGERGGLDDGVDGAGARIDKDLEVAHG